MVANRRPGPTAPERGRPPGPAGFAVGRGCVIVAGLYGAATVNRRILVVQAAPAAIALLVVVLANATA